MKPRSYTPTKPRPRNECVWQDDSDLSPYDLQKILFAVVDLLKAQVYRHTNTETGQESYSVQVPNED
jgi:hypothetical protein